MDAVTIGSLAALLGGVVALVGAVAGASRVTLLGRWPALLAAGAGLLATLGAADLLVIDRYGGPGSFAPGVFVPPHLIAWLAGPLLVLAAALLAADRRAVRQAGWLLGFGSSAGLLLGLAWVVILLLQPIYRYEGSHPGPAFLWFLIASVIGIVAVGADIWLVRRAMSQRPRPEAIRFG
jgi:hypothetical protein